MKRLIGGIVTAIAVILGSAQAGTTYRYEAANINQQQDYGQIEFLSIQYDETSQRLDFGVTLGPSNTGTSPNGGWFVLSPGPNPKNSNSELAILYLDFNPASGSSTGNLYAYRYNGVAGQNTSRENSWRDRDAFITSYENGLNVNSTDIAGRPENRIELSASLDVSSFAPGTFGPDWTGVSFEDKIGTWIHFMALDQFWVDGTGRITEFDKLTPQLQTWYDITNDHTTKVNVSEPAGFALAGLLMVAGLVSWRRRRAV